MLIDIQEKQLHTKERASDFNLDLPNEIASDDPTNEEDKSPLQRHEFSFSSQGVRRELRKAWLFSSSDCVIVTSFEVVSSSILVIGVLLEVLAFLIGYKLWLVF
ncbi:hypothetical protein RHSIM_Rhsim09G0098600 [Rhododendron simsii]|uniref:Uncharacterized protein n=1 Tax=Rhododendron simsii TaxID=118357 RepID=A0A834LEH3_RHOSS|nr:hypothetical protein RHSIM_Rhsim09G0098600 [Rhododendron simsii]